MTFKERVMWLRLPKRDYNNRKQNDARRQSLEDRIVGSSKTWNGKTLIDEAYRAKVAQATSHHMDWMEDALNGHLIGKEFVKPLLYKGNTFELVIRPRRFSEEVREKYE